MGGYSTKRTLLLLAPIMLLHLLISSSYGEAVNSSEKGVCVSKKGRPYELEGKLPKSADLKFKDLNLCKAFHDKTCCSASRMLSAYLAVQNLATHGEAAQDCLDLFEILECSVCHPDVGTQSVPLRICASLCDSLFEACSDAYFSSDVINNVIVPCGASIICVKASKWETNGTRFCRAMGFTVTEDKPCYGSKPGFGTVVKSLIKTETAAWFENLKKLVRDVSDMALVQQFSWVAALVGLGTMIFNRWRYGPRDARRLRRNRNRRT